VSIRFDTPGAFSSVRPRSVTGSSPQLSASSLADFSCGWRRTVSDLAHDLGSAVCKSLDALDLATCGDRMSVLTIGFALLLLAGIGVVGFGLSRIA
jgi:hypothetical protein